MDRVEYEICKCCGHNKRVMHTPTPEEIRKNEAEALRDEIGDVVGNLRYQLEITSDQKVSLENKVLTYIKKYGKVPESLRAASGELKGLNFKPLEAKLSRILDLKFVSPYNDY